jgi:hypothetical protein
LRFGLNAVLDRMLTTQPSILQVTDA